QHVSKGRSGVRHPHLYRSNLPPSQDFLPRFPPFFSAPLLPHWQAIASLPIRRSHRRKQSSVIAPFRTVRAYNLTTEKFPASPSYRMGINTEEVGNLAVAPIAKFLRFQPRIKTSLLLVKQTEKQDDGRLHLWRQVFPHRRVAQFPDSLSLFTGESLVQLHAGIM